MNLKDNLKRLRKEHNLSQEDLAEKLGVSRQSVSKWESGQAYPEMDKVLQICQLFNLNIDELLNQNIKEVNNIKQSKINVNKYIDDFLDYVTKTIDMFTSMKFISKIKCIFEQFIIIGVLVLLFFIVGVLVGNIFNNMFSFIPWDYLSVIRNILESIYIIICTVIGVTLVLHIFKVRYLDYYIIVNKKEEIKEDKIEKINEEHKEENKIYLEKKKEKIIIRDPKHSEYKFIKGLLKSIIFFIKFIVVVCSSALFITLISFVILLVLSFLFIKTGLVFLGSLLILISSILINIILLIICYNFIISQRMKKKQLAISFLLSIILIGIGIGFVAIGITKFNIIETFNDSSYNTTTQEIEFQKDLIILDYYGLNYVESNNNNLKIEIKHSDIINPEILLNDNYLNINMYNDEIDLFKSFETIINDINSKKIINYSNYQITIYTTEKNINTLKNNLVKYYKQENNSRLEYYVNKTNDLQIEIQNKNDKIYSLENEINTLKQKINDLENELNNTFCE